MSRHFQTQLCTCTIVHLAVLAGAHVLHHASAAVHICSCASGSAGMCTFIAPTPALLCTFAVVHLAVLAGSHLLNHASAAVHMFSSSSEDNQHGKWKRHCYTRVQHGSTCTCTFAEMHNATGIVAYPCSCQQMNVHICKHAKWDRHR